MNEIEGGRILRVAGLKLSCAAKQSDTRRFLTLKFNLVRAKPKIVVDEGCLFPGQYGQDCALGTLRWLLWRLHSALTGLLQEGTALITLRQFC